MTTSGLCFPILVKPAGVEDYFCLKRDSVGPFPLSRAFSVSSVISLEAPGGGFCPGRLEILDSF